MTKNHRNRSWRAQWTPAGVSRTAVHRSGVTARVGPCPGDPGRECVILDNTAGLDASRWDIEELEAQAGKLWAEGAF